jgi:hypothetical protein
MKKTIFVHVGLHKTGSTSIQWALTIGRHAFADAGFLYPYAGTPDEPGLNIAHHLFPWSVVTTPNFMPEFRAHPNFRIANQIENIWEALRRQIDRAPQTNVVLSSEEFDILSKEEIVSFRTQLNDYRVVPVICLRNTADFVESSYRTTLMYSTDDQNIESFIKSQRTRIDFPALIGDWFDVCGSDDIRIISFDDPTVKKNIVPTFLNSIGVENLRLPDEALERKNDGFPAPIVEMTRFLRAKNTDESIVQGWLSNMKRRVVEFPGVSYGRFISSDLTRELDLEYYDQVDRLCHDDRYRGRIFGNLTQVIERKNEVTIKNVADAILMLGLTSQDVA